MKRIMISIKPNWVQKLMAQEKWLECRKNKALRKAIEKEIKEKGKAKILVYCTKWDRGLTNTLVKLKNGEFRIMRNTEELVDKAFEIERAGYNGTVVGYLIITHVYNVYCYHAKDDRDDLDDTYYIEKNALDDEEMGTNTYLEEGSCLSQSALYDYYGGKNGYALYVSEFEIFDKPKEFKEFKKTSLDC